MAGVNVATLIAKLEAQTRDFDRAINRSEERLRGLEGASQSSGRALQRMGSLARTVAASGIIYFGKELFELGVQAEAWGRRFDTVFADAADVVSDWADDMNERLGMSQERLEGTAAAVGDLFVPMGFARRAAADMTVEVLHLAAALSEWTGGQRSAEEAANIITRAILGEREALISLGVKISEADVQAELLARGMDNLTGSALEQARAQVTLELITRKSTDALAAFEDGGSEAMRASNELKAAIDEAKVALGNMLVVLTPLISGLARFAGVLADAFTPEVVSSINAQMAAIKQLTLADLEAVRANDMLYQAILRVRDAARDVATAGQSGPGRGRSAAGSAVNPIAPQHSGGIVPGPVGSAVPILAMAGERVVPTGLHSNQGGGATVIVNVAGSVLTERDLAERLRRVLRDQRIRGGSLEL